MQDSVARDDWKDRYRELLSELEAKEAAWNAVEATLRSTASRLGIAAMGRDEALDRKLELIVDRVRRPGGEADLDAALDGLSAAVLEQERGRAPDGGVDLAAFVARLPLPAPNQKRYLEELASDEMAERSRALNELAVDIAGLLDVADGDSGGQVAAARQLLARLRASGDTAPGLAAQLATLDEQLVGAAPDVPLILTELADVIVAALDRAQSQKTELEAFLEQVTDRLAEFESFAGASRADDVARRADTEALGDGVANHMHQLRDAVQTGEPEDLRRRVEQRLDGIAQQIQSFREREAARATAAHKRNEALQEQVNQLRVRTADLAKRCGDQEQRLMHDTLTGVHTRYAYDRRLQEEFQRWQRHGQPLSYSIWDIDHFKRVNDSYGHLAGDQLLAAVARVLAEQTRTEDFVARLGGEEFAILFVATPLDAAHALAERLRVAVSAESYHHDGTPIAVTISCGLTDFRAGDTPKSVYERADRALYAAKNGGRNRSARL